MKTLTRTADSKARVGLPKTYANATVIIEQVSDSELRIRRARIIPEDEVRFSEERPIVLSDRDRDRFLAILDNPPPANAALRRLMSESKTPNRRTKKRGNG